MIIIKAYWNISPFALVFVYLLGNIIYFEIIFVIWNGFFLAFQDPENFSNHPEESFSPSMFISDQEESYFDDPNYKPPDC